MNKVEIGLDVFSNGAHDNHWCLPTTLEHVITDPGIFNNAPSCQ